KNAEAPTPSADLKRQIDQFMRTVEAFKEKNDQHFHELRTRKVDDVVLREEVERINGAIDKLKARHDAEIIAIKRAAILAGAGGSAAPPEIAEYHKAFVDYLRGDYDGRERELKALQHKAVETKALATSSETDGGFTVVPQIDATIRDLQLLVSPIRGIAQVMTIGAGSLKVLFNLRGTAAGWVGESDPRVQTSTSQLVEMEFVPGELYAMPAATQQMVEDSFVNVEQWIADEIALRFAVQEGQAFVAGDGVKKPRGFLGPSYTVVADSTSLAYPNIGYIPTGQNGGFLPTQTSPIQQGADIFFDVIAALKYPYRANARWVANRRTVSQMRKIKSAFADYLWVPGLQSGQPDSFAGYPLIEAEDMPDIASGSYSIAYGDFRQFYLIVDRVGVSVLRDPYSSKPYVLYYTRKRVGGGVQNFEAAKLVKFATS
ncbi:MAG: phage major capsid protein, partial [Methylobacteriaceae bacterium]|nr:phage major capsid protein [Methylobacteriaceae bacterium]